MTGRKSLVEAIARTEARLTELDAERSLNHIPILCPKVPPSRQDLGELTCWRDVFEGETKTLGLEPSGVALETTDFSGEKLSFRLET